MDKQSDFVLRSIEDKGIKFVRLWFTDVLGTLKSISIAPAEVEKAFAEGIGIDGSSIQGFTRAFEADVLARPDASTFQELPWSSGTAATARMFCDIYNPDGQPTYSDPRQVLKRSLQKAADAGFTFFAHPEIEFYLLKSIDPDNLQPVDNAGYFDHVPGGTAHDFRRKAVQMLEDLGIPVEFSHHEIGPGQNEIDLRSADALTMADSIMTFRSVVKEVAIAEGVRATFMPKPFQNFPGSGMHTHLSLFEGEKNAFYEAGAQYQLSKVARGFIAGVLRHASEIALVTNQFSNSYKRLWGGDEAPSFVTWGHNNRSALVRIPIYKPGKSQAARIEYRAMDSATNPYLAFALILSAGLKGIAENLELPDEATHDVWNLTDVERKALGYESLPHSLADAIKLAESSELVAEVLGEQAFEYVLSNKREEWQQYRRQITRYELDRHLGN